MALSPFADALFVFCNKKRDKLKVLYWDKTGFCLWYKRLEKAKFKWPKKHSADKLSIDKEQMAWLLSGLDILKMQKHASLHYEGVGL